MGLTMSQRKAVTKATATRYRSASKGAKAVILDELCATTGCIATMPARRFGKGSDHAGCRHLARLDRRPTARM